jgi:hypothetical protein
MIDAYDMNFSAFTLHKLIAIRRQNSDADQTETLTAAQLIHRKAGIAWMLFYGFEEEDSS